MVSIRTLTLLVVFAIPALALPSKQDRPIFHDRQDDPVPTIIRATFTFPLVPTETSAATSETSDVEISEPEINPCAAVLCLINTTCEVVNGEAQCIPLPPLAKCGPNICPPDTYCCNESCGICAPIDGGVCITLFCGDVETIEE